MSKKLFGIGAALVVGGLILLGVAMATEPPRKAAGTSAGTQQPTPQQNSTNQNKPSPTASLDSQPSTAAVVIEGMAFSPASVTVKAGTTVAWTNKDSIAHTVTANGSQSGGPNSELLGTGKTYSTTFSAPGTYSYHCTPHPGMKGTVVVVE